MCCRLRTYSINFHPDNDAISYVWGEEWDGVYIFCHRKRLLVPQNLSDVLQRLRCQDRSRILWADSICTDQSNDDEQGHQVQLMRAIFRQADNVNAWLGCGDNFDIDMAFQLIEHLYDAWRLNLPRKQLEPQVSIYQWKQLGALLESPWFYRVWILQEVGLASNAILLCGSNEAQWKELTSLTPWVMRKFLSFLNEHNSSLRGVDGMNLNFRKGMAEDVRKALSDTRCVQIREIGTTPF